MAAKQANDKKEKPETKAAEEVRETETEEPVSDETIAREEESAREDVEKIKKLADENYDKYLRLAAEFDNFKRRTQKEKDELGQYVAADTIEKLLPVLDNLERALASCEDDKGSAMYDGVEKVLKQFRDALTALGVKPIDAAGKPFDPNLHNAVMHVEEEGAGENIVVEELMKGYLLKDRVIRHSMVKVAN